MPSQEKPSQEKPSQERATPEEVALRIAEAAKRANAEAEARRARQTDVQLPPELGGPKGLEPTRYGDWERKGIVSDF